MTDTVGRGAGKETADGEQPFSVEHIRQSLKRLAWIVPLVVLAAMLVLTVCFYLFERRPQANEYALWRVRFVAEDTRQQIEKLMADIESALQANQEWSQGKQIDASDAKAFNHQIIPLINRLPINTVQLANDDGQAILLLKTEGGWENRLVDLPKRGGVQHWLHWKGKDAVTPRSEEHREVDWDPRQRPWYTGTLMAPEWQAVWMAPHVLKVTNEGAISVSVRWRDASGHQWVLSFAVDLAGLSDPVQYQRLGERGQVALVMADGSLLGLSRQDLSQNPEAIRKSILQEPAKLGLHVLDKALLLATKQRTSEKMGESQAFVLPAAEAGDGNTWLIGLSPFAVGRQVFRVVALAPAAEFTVQHPKRSLALAGAFMVIGALSMLAAYLMIRPIRQSLTLFFTALMAKRLQAEKQAMRRITVADITERMRQAQRVDELASTLLRELAPRLTLGYAVFCLWHEEEKRLGLIASYAGEKAVGDRGSASEGSGEERAESSVIDAGLLEQCAKDRYPVVLKNPGADYVRIRSGLGDASPAMILISPVQYAGHLFAVMELAGLRDFSEDDYLLLADLEPIIAMNLEILLRAGRTAELLAQTAANNERHQLILGAVGDGIWGVDIDERVGFINRTAMEILGYAESEVIGKNIHSLVHSRHLDGRLYPAGECLVCRTVRDGITRTVDDDVFWHKDGHPLRVEYTVTAIHSQGEITGAVVVFRDIGRRREAELALKENESVFRQLLEDSPAAMSNADEDGRLLRFNEPFAELLGMTKESLKNVLMRDFWARPEERDAFVEMLKTGGGFIRNYRTHLRRGDGSLVGVSINSRWRKQGEQRQLLSWIVEVDEEDEGEESNKGDAAPKRSRWNSTPGTEEKP